MSSLDCQGIDSGKCTNCNVCEKFVAESGSIRYAYCNCVPAHHHDLSDTTNISLPGSGCERGTFCKHQRQAQILEKHLKGRITAVFFGPFGLLVLKKIRTRRGTRIFW